MSLIHVGCGGEVLEDDSISYPYEHEDGHVEQLAALRCRRCGQEIVSDGELEAEWDKEESMAKVKQCCQKWELAPTIHQQRPHCCPICAGRGTMRAGFYSRDVSMDMAVETCRTCKGSGIVWG